MIAEAANHQPEGQSKPTVAKLALSDGTVFTGVSFGAAGTTTGEVVFNTSMTGYQEILTDPSYRGQLVTMTYPEIGNYGVNLDDVESSKPQVSGFIVRNVSGVASNHRSTGSLQDYLAEHGIVGISNIDTRSLVRHIRSKGAMDAVISTEILDDAALVEKAKASPGLVGRDLVREVVPSESTQWSKGLGGWWAFEDAPEDASSATGEDADRPHVVALDFGMKRNIARHLFDQGFRVTILPGTASADEVLKLNPDGIFLSNGPGDPEPLTYAIETIQQLIGKAPIFGICLGHQLFALACGAKTYKLKFGHRGANQPVQNLETEKIEITSQNHGFAVSPDNLPACLKVTHKHLNDGTIAGLKHVDHPAFSVQYHPEASAGPHDSQYLFNVFYQMVAGQTPAKN
jgi:carbamoyl-phosphate synthase small subunit